MRLLLDAHLSPKAIGGPLRKDGHDVLPLAEVRGLDGLSDWQVLELAAEERRILVTRNARHFSPLLRIWAGSGRPHHGCILIWSRPHDDFRGIVEGVKRCLRERPRPKDWVDISIAL